MPEHAPQVLLSGGDLVETVRSAAPAKDKLPLGACDARGSGNGAADSGKGQSVRFLVADDQQSVLQSYHQIIEWDRDSRARETEMLGVTPGGSGSESPATVAAPLDINLALCKQGEEAFDAVRNSLEKGEPFAGAFIDVRMPPGPDGVWTAEQIRGLDSDVYIVIVTGYDDYDPEDIARRVPPSDRLLYLQKPFHATEIRRFLWALATRWLAEKASRQIYAELQQKNYELREAEEKASEQAALLQALLDNIPDSVYFKDCDHQFIAVSRAKAEYHGTTPEEMVGKTDFDLLPEVPAKVAHAEEQRVMETSKPIVNKIEQISGPDGSQRYYSVSKVPYSDPNGQVAGIVGISRDITVQKQAQLKLKQERDTAQQYLDVAGVMLTVADAAETITMINPKGCETLGYSEEDLIGRNWFDLLVPERIREEVRGVFKRLMAGEVKPVEYYENPLVTKDGEERIIAFHNTVLRDENGGITAVLTSGEDVTERKQAEQEIKEANRHLEEALRELRTTQKQIIEDERLRALGEMASGIAHDFNNNLQPILTFAHFLAEKPELLDDREKSLGYIKIIEAAAEDAVEVVGRLRQFYRPADDEDEFRPVDTAQIIDRAVALTQPMWKEQARANAAEIRVETNLQPVPTVLGNAAELRQAFINLVLNAVDAMPQGGTLGVGSRAADGTVVLEVSDTGIGMSQEAARRCLEPFFSTKRERGGTGLGLAAVHGIVRRHGGEIDIDSEVGRGTTVRIRLPVASEAGADESRAAVGTPVATKRILLVEDEAPVCKAIAVDLTRTGHSVETAVNGSEALEKLEADQFDLIITDQAMPDMSGDELAAAVKQTSAKTPVILLTGFGDLMNVTEQMPEAVDLVVSKPASIHELQQAITQVTEG